MMEHVDDCYEFMKTPSKASIAARVDFSTDLTPFDLAQEFGLPEDSGRDVNAPRRIG